MEEIKAMLTELAGTQKVEVNNFNHIVSFDNAIGKDTMYFLWGVVDNKKRNSDDDIKKKCYFYVDIDIRSVYLQEHWKILSDDEQDEEIMKILDKLAQRKIDTMRYVVYTGNWLHLYYVGDEIEIDKTTYSKWVAYFYDIINFALSDLWYTCDQACKNISRISRLPWSINTRRKTQKNKETKEDELVWDMWPTECKILLINELDKTVFNWLKDYAKEWEAIVAEKEIIKTYQKEDNDIWAEINKIDILPIVCDHLWLKAKKNDKDTITLYDGKWAIGAYVYKPFNIVKRTGTTRLDRETYTTYEFVLFEICNNDKRATKERFEKHYNIKFDNNEKKYFEANIKLPTKQSFDREIYRYPDTVFDHDFQALRSSELCLVASPTNSGKSTFVQWIFTRNKDKHKCLYINLEFDLERWWEDSRKRSKWMLVKIKGSKEDPYTVNEKLELDNYMAKCRNKMDILDMSQGTKLEDIIEKINEYIEKWYSLFAIDTFSSIEKADDYDKQNLIIRTLHDLCKITGICVIAVHHFNKTAKQVSGSQKLSDLSSVVVTLFPEEVWSKTAVRYTLAKDKAFFGTKEKLLILEWWKYTDIAESNLSSNF